jgi:hypothetical protein
MFHGSFSIGFSEKIDLFSYFCMRNVSFQPVKKRRFIEKTELDILGTLFRKIWSTQFDAV